MAEHVYEYPMDDFEPSKACMQWAITDGQCCEHSTHRHDCEIVQGYRKQQFSHEPVPMTTREKLAFTAAIIFTLAGIGMVLS